jgi:hypothetical protein
MIGLRCSLYATRVRKARRPQVSGLGQKPTTVALVNLVRCVGRWRVAEMTQASGSVKEAPLAWGFFGSRLGKKPLSRNAKRGGA